MILALSPGMTCCQRSPLPVQPRQRPRPPARDSAFIGSDSRPDAPAAWGRRRAKLKSRRDNMEMSWVDFLHLSLNRIFLDRFQFLKLRSRGVILVQRIAAADH